MRKRPEIGLLSPYWSFWEGVVDDDPRAVHAQLFARSSAVASEYGDVVWSVGADELDASLPTVDLILVVVTMASPPAAIRAFLEQRPDAVVLVWALHDSPAIADPFTHQSITVRGATVGASMVTASLSRAGITHDAVLGDVESHDVHDAVRRAAAASMIRGSRLLVIGEPLDGYDFVVPPISELTRIGVELVARRPEELSARADQVPEAELVALRAELGECPSPVTSMVGVDAAVRFALALHEMVEAAEAQAGTLNCHVSSLRGGTRWSGVAPCFALGRQTSRGCPFTCTGDVNTALAMLLVAALGRPTMYHEMEAIDEITDDVVLANSGEYDDRFAAIAPARVTANPWFPGDNPTPILAFQVASGPASVVAVAVVADRLRVIVAEGQFTERPTVLTGTMTAAFRFDAFPAAVGWSEWVRAGAGHHACATDAHVRRDLAVICRHLGITLISIGDH